MKRTAKHLALTIALSAIATGHVVSATTLGEDVKIPDQRPETMIFDPHDLLSVENEKKYIGSDDVIDVVAIPLAYSTQSLDDFGLEALEKWGMLSSDKPGAVVVYDRSVGFIAIRTNPAAAALIPNHELDQMASQVAPFFYDQGNEQDGFSALSGLMALRIRTGAPVPLSNEDQGEEIDRYDEPLEAHEYESSNAQVGGLTSWVDDDGSININFDGLTSVLMRIIFLAALFAPLSFLLHLFSRVLRTSVSVPPVPVGASQIQTERARTIEMPEQEPLDMDKEIDEFYRELEENSVTKELASSEIDQAQSGTPAELISEEGGDGPFIEGGLIHEESIEALGDEIAESITLPKSIFERNTPGERPAPMGPRPKMGPK